VSLPFAMDTEEPEASSALEKILCQALSALLLFAGHLHRRYSVAR
jgi:hypothetical protein